MKYKVGDKVKIKSIDWYNQNKDKSGCVFAEDAIVFTSEMAHYCGQVMTIERADCIDNSYFMNVFWWTDDMIEGLAKKDTEGAMKEITFTHHIGLYSEEIHIADGFEFQYENGNVINARKVKIVKKGPKYPTTYEKCCKVISLIPCYNVVCDYHRGEELSALYQLLICRDAYWKIASWEPDWENSEFKYCIKVIGNKFECISEMNIKCTLAFPTEEMRDTFYENFKDLIESCKELL